MKKRFLDGKLKKIAAVALSVIVFTGTMAFDQVQVHAEDYEMQETVDNTDTLMMEENAEISDENLTEEVEMSEIAGTDEELGNTDASEAEETVETGTESKVEADAEKDADVQEDTEKDTEDDTEIKAVTLSKTVGNVCVTASAAAGVLPADATLSVEEIATTPAMENAIEGAVTDEVKEIISYDIKIFSKGVVVQPEDGTVSITFSGIAVGENEVADVVYTSADAAVAETEQTAVNGENVGFEASHFSVYNIVIRELAKDGKTDMIALVAAQGTTQLDTLSYFGNADYAITHAEDGLINVYKSADGNLIINGLGNAEGGIAEFALSGNGKKTLAFKVYVSKSPSMTSAQFAKEFYEKIGTSQGAVVNDTELKNFFAQKTTGNSIDSTSVGGAKAETINSLINVSGFSYKYYKEKSGTNDVSWLYYIPISFVNDFVEAGGETVQSFYNKLNSSLTMVFCCDAYSNDSLTAGREYMKLKMTNISGGTSYLILDPATRTILQPSPSYSTNYAKDLEDGAETMVTYILPEQYKDDYAIAANSGALTKTVSLAAKKDSATGNNTIHMDSFDAELETASGTGEAGNGTRKAVTAVKMTLASEACGYKNGQYVTIPEGTVISTFDGQTVGFADGFDEIELLAGKEIKINITPIATYEITIYDAAGTSRVESVYEGLSYDASLLADAAKAEDAAATYEFAGWSNTANGTVLSAAELENALTAITSDIALYPVFTATMKPVEPETEPSTGKDTNTDTTTELTTDTILSTDTNTSIDTVPSSETISQVLNATVAQNTAVTATQSIAAETAKNLAQDANNLQTGATVLRNAGNRTAGNRTSGTNTAGAGTTDAGATNAGTAASEDAAGGTTTIADEVTPLAAGSSASQADAEETVTITDEETPLAAKADNDYLRMISIILAACFGAFFITFLLIKRRKQDEE